MSALPPRSLRSLRSLRAPRARRTAALSAGALALGLLPVAATTGSASAAAAAGVVISAAAPVSLAEDGGAATVPVTLTTADAAPLARAIAVRYTTGRGTAAAGTDYRPATGTLTFPAGTRSGATRELRLPLARTATAETAETVPLRLTAPAGARVARQPLVVISGHGLPYQDPRRPVRARVADLLARMTLEEKVGQMTQAERGAVTDDPNEITTWTLGSVLSGGGSTPTPNTPQAWADMVDRFQTAALATRLAIPLIYGVDSVHGHGNLYGTTVFPHNIGLGATRDPRLVQAVEHLTAIETRATGPQWSFAPCICAARDDRWGRTYESFSEDPGLVTAMETGIEGFQGRPGGRDLARPDHVLATAKHYAGDGDTRYGTGSGDYKIDQGVTVTDRAGFWRTDLRQYVTAVRRHDVGTVMPSFSSVDWTEDGVGNPVKMHANRELITDVLKHEIGFDGFVITDWEAIHQLPGDWAAQVRTGVNAGSDMFMEPNRFRQFETTLLAEVRAGRVPMSRIDDAVRRILTKKFELGLFEKPVTDRRYLDSVGSPEHRAVARQAVAESQVLLKNAGHALPLRRDAKIYVAGRNADDIGNQAGGWTLQWQGVSGDGVIPGSTILQGIRDTAGQVTYSEDAAAPIGDADVGLVVVGETPYAEGFGDVGGPVWPWGTPEQREPKTMQLSATDKAAIDKVCSAVATCVVSVVSGRPVIVDSAQLDKIDALVASWLPGSEGAGVADVLFGKRPFTGRLPMTWPRSLDQEPINVGDADYDPLYPFGWGLSTRPGNTWRDRAARAFLAADGQHRQQLAKLIARFDQFETARSQTAQTRRNPR